MQRRRNQPETLRFRSILSVTDSEKDHRRDQKPELQVESVLELPTLWYFVSQEVMLRVNNFRFFNLESGT